MSVSSLSSLSDHEETPAVHRTYETRLNAFEKYNDVGFKARFRLSKETVIYLESLFGSSIKPVTKRNRPIQPVDQILITLRFYATGSYQRVIGDIFHVEQPTIHRIVHKVTAKIAALSSLYINMPTPEEFANVANGFYAIASFPRVIGAIDCPILKLIHQAEHNLKYLYRNRKGYFSLNVQMVCDTDLYIRSVIARWPGSVHDSTIFNDSPLCAQLERGDFDNMLIVGDSGYPCCRYLLTPILNTQTAAEEAYNRSQISTRNPIERLFGVLKRRLPCLQNGMGLKIDNIPPIIVACAVLHNIALLRQDSLDIHDVDNSINLNDFESTPAVQPGPASNENFIVRNVLINTHCSLYKYLF